MSTDVKNDPAAAFTDNKIGFFQPSDGSSHVDNILIQKVEGYKPDPSKEIRVDRERIANDAQANGNLLRQTDAQIIPRDETGTQTALRHLNQAVGEAVQRMGITSILGDELKDAQEARQSAELEQKIKPPVIMAGTPSISLG